MKNYLFKIISIVLFSYSSFSQNYNEILGDYYIELVGAVDKNNKDFTEYHCNVNLYDHNNKLIKQYYSILDDMDIGTNNYEMRKIVINKITGEEAVFLLGISNGANTIFGSLKCFILKEEYNGSEKIKIPILISYPNGLNLEMISENENPKITDIIKDIDNDGVMEIIDNKCIQLEAMGKITAKWVTVIYHLEGDKFNIVNDKFSQYLDGEIQNLKNDINEDKVKCNEKDEFKKIVYENLMGSIIIHYALLNRIDEGRNIFRSNYKCNDSEGLLKKILVYYNEQIIK